MKKILKGLLILFIGVLLGIVANRNRAYLINAQFIRDHLHFRKVIDEKNKIIDADDVMVFLAIGQSNAANYGEGNYVSKNEIYNYYNGNLYKAKEPLLGADGGGSSPWMRLADMAIDGGLYKKVVIVPCALGGTSVQCWSDGDCRKKLEGILNYLKNDNIKLTHVFWLQGETDNVDNTSLIDYKSRLEKIIKLIKDGQSNSIFYTSITSFFPYSDKPLGVDSNITHAQQQITKEMNNVKLGPNTDSLNLAIYRRDAVHFTAKGLDVLAEKWFEKIK